tara:strand:- start:3297 stop:3875 length:579 start_codon:yes stop_codon:yes gene_type:complete
MALYANEDSNAAKAAVEKTIAADASGATVVFIDATEAGLAANRARGLVSPGWWSYQTYTDSAGNTRHKAECLVNIQGPEANASETQADDAIAADVTATIAISSQPADAAVAVGAAMNLAVTAACTPPGNASVLTYQWQKKSGTRYTNISGATSATYTVGTYAASNAGTYRVKINSTNGAAEVISDTAAITTA